ncbi:MAG: glycosyltransferase family 4 protein [Deltaproteobacteria bacterium]|nr:glycosyltransferase family 4 protein [Deltaproteobacteria bacterium]
MTKILYVVHGFPPRNVAGTETYTFSLAREIARDNQVRVFYRFTDPGKEEYAVEKGTYQGLNYWAINNTYRADNSFEAYYLNPELEPPFRACLDDFKPDLVHFTYLLGGLTAGYVHLAKEYDLPILVTLTDFILLCCWGQLLDRKGEICKGPGGGLHCVPCLWGESLVLGKKPLPALLKKVFPAGWIAKMTTSENLKKIRTRLEFLLSTIKKADAIIAPSQFLGDTYQQWGVPKEGLVRFGFIGQLAPHKGLHVLIDALTFVSNYRFKLFIYGDKSNPEAAAYLDGLLSRSDSEKVEFRGTFPMEDISEVYGGIDVLVVPSLWHENSPLVILYGRYTRTPLVVSDLGGMSEFVEHQKTGLVFPAGEPRKLAACLQFFLDDSGAVKKMAEHIRPAKTIKEHGREIVRIYSQLTKS